MAPSLPASVSVLHHVGSCLQACGHPSHMSKVTSHLLYTDELGHPWGLGVCTGVA